MFRIASRTETWIEFVNVFFKSCSWRVSCSWRLRPSCILFWRPVGGRRKNNCIERFQSAWSVFLYPEWIHLRFRLPLYTAVSRNVMSLLEISAVNFMVGWWEFTCGMNLSISGLRTSHSWKMSPIYRFQIIGFMTLFLKICVSRSAIKIFAKETAILVPLAVPWICR